MLTPAVAFHDNLSSFAFERNSQDNTVVEVGKTNISDEIWAFHRVILCTVATTGDKQGLHTPPESGPYWCALPHSPPYAASLRRSTEAGQFSPLFYYGFVLFAQPHLRCGPNFVIDVIRVRVKTYSKPRNRIVRGKLIRTRRPCGPTDARAVVSQQQIAKLAHISQALLSNFENAKTDLDADTLQAVEDAIMEIGRHRASEGFRILSDAVEHGEGPKSSSAL